MVFAYRQVRHLDVLKLSSQPLVNLCRRSMVLRHCSPALQLVPCALVRKCELASLSDAGSFSLGNHIQSQCFTPMSRRPEPRSCFGKIVHLRALQFEVMDRHCSSTSFQLAKSATAYLLPSSPATATVLSSMLQSWWQTAGCRAFRILCSLQHTLHLASAA